MPEIFSSTRSYDWFHGDDNYCEITDKLEFTKLKLPADTVSAFVDEFSVHNDIGFSDLWVSNDNITYRPGLPMETVLLRVYDDEITAYWVERPGSYDGYSADYTSLGYDKQREMAWVKYHGAGSYFSIGKPFRFTGKLREAVLTKLCEEASSPLKVIQRDSQKYLEMRRAALKRIEGK